MAKQSGGKREQSWRRILAQFEPHCETVSAFCERLGLSESSFYRWSRDLQRLDADQCHIPLFQPVVVTPAATVTTDAIAVRLRGRRVLRVSPGFDADLLRQLVTVLEAVPQPDDSSC
jgi:hypothetical protein